MCFPGKNINGNNGYDGHDVLCEMILKCCTSAETCLLTGTRIDMAFTGDHAVPGPKDADWKANNSLLFQTSLAKFGARLITGIKP